ncbi:Fe-S cluster assembly ATPase SufC [Candidatus Peregrinibacteria bacterium]|nr:Fe-S cluster assembly ATPase SufC [Candidatus Peregrinibacteria bacterium]
MSTSKKSLQNSLEIKYLHAETQDGLKILNGINLTIKSGEIHAIMGPNGSGKSTLCKVLMGHPKYKITKGKILFNDKEITELEPDERAHLGLFLGFQHPLEITGVTLSNFLRHAKNACIKANNKDAKTVDPGDFLKTMKKKAQDLKMDEKFVSRSVNEGSSGGERKRAEIVQMAVIEPKIALLDEIDSGLDIDALKIVAEEINNAHQKNNSGILLITHYQRILNYIKPNFVHIMHAGKIIQSGTSKLAEELEEKGYENFRPKAEIAQNTISFPARSHAGTKNKVKPLPKALTTNF